jgi:hypothetical protein
MFDHYIITRFNLRNPKWEAQNNGKSLLTDAWMEERFWLFENFCLPTVAAQTNKNFKWLLFSDTSTKENYKNHLLKITEKYPNIHVIFINGMPEFYDAITSYIASHSKEKKHIITTRIDNDDSLHKDFIKRIQEQFNFQKRHVVDLLKGYSLQIKPNVILGKKDHIFNPFISLIEENKNPETIWSTSHNLWKKEKSVTFLKDQRLWMAVIHQNNKTNNFNGFGPVSWDSIKNDFLIAEEMSNYIRKNQIKDNAWRMLQLRNYLDGKFKVISKICKRKIGLYRFKK